MKNKYISVMGTMGSGKTTVARLIAKELKFQLVEENFGENAFLPRFYSDMNRWAFHSQTFFLMEKISQMLETPKLLEKGSVVQDTPIVQDAFSYAKAQHVLGHMDDAEWKLYQKIYKSFEPYFPKPDCIVFLETSITSIIDRIEKRGRGYEQKIPQSYLELLDMLNHKWLSENLSAQAGRSIPVLIIKTDGLNFVTSKIAQQNLIHEIRKKSIRKKMLALRATVQNKALADEIITAKVLALPQVLTAKRICIYTSFPLPLSGFVISVKSSHNSP